MKKIITFLFGFIILLIIVGGWFIKGQASQRSVSNKLIRFHVIANSDTVEDQTLKLKIRDKVLEYIYPKLKNSNSIEESRKIIKRNNVEIIKIAKNVVKHEGYKYSIDAKLSKENFPIKTYGNITLPQGRYEAYRIIIGNGKGHNWWCVMFPPLCFVDITKGEVAYKETENEMKKVLSEKEYDMVNNKVEIKFKLVEEIEDIVNKK